MGLLSDILLRYLNPTPADAEVIAKELAQLNNRTEAQTRTMGSTGAARGSYSNNVSVGDSEGIYLTSPFTGKKTIWLEPDGDAFFGADLDKPSQTSLIIFSNDQLYNRENLAFGDVLLGDNSANRANLLWDRSTGRLNFRGGTTTQAYIDTNGKLFAQLADIGGWNVDATRIYSDGNEIVLDSANQRIEVGSSDEILLDGGNALIRSGNFVTGSAGWQIDNEKAEFQNIVARGEIYTSVFVKGLIDARAGTMVVSKSAGALAEEYDISQAGIDPIIVRDQPGGGFLFENGDRITIDWFTPTQNKRHIIYDVSNRVDNGDGTQSYDVTYVDGPGGSDVIPAGTAIVDWGVSGDGYVWLSADDAIAPGGIIGIRKWSGDDPVSVPTDIFRAGNMDGAFGNVQDKPGFGVGDYAAGNYLTYGGDNPGVFQIFGADGMLSLSASGLEIEADSLSFSPTSAISFNDPNGDRFAWLTAYYGTSPDVRQVEVKADGSALTMPGVAFLSGEGATGKAGEARLKATSGSVVAEFIANALSTSDPIFAWQENGSDVMRLSGGELGIGTTSTNGWKLNVQVDAEGTGEYNAEAIFVEGESIFERDQLNAGGNGTVLGLRRRNMNNEGRAVLRLAAKTKSSVTPGAGLGVTLAAQAENTSGSDSDLGWLGWSWDVATAGSEAAHFHMGISGTVTNARELVYADKDKYAIDRFAAGVDVGIGTSPALSSKLHIADSGRAVRLSIEDTGGNQDVEVRFRRGTEDGTIDWNGSYFTLTKNKGESGDIPARVHAGQFAHDDGVVSINDDSVYSIANPSGGNGGIIVIGYRGGTGSGVKGMFVYRAGSSPFIQHMWDRGEVLGTGTTIDTTTGALTGTTGTNGRFTISIDGASGSPANTLYFENRLGSGITVTIVLIGQ